MTLELPKYLQRAITSPTAQSGNYASLTQEQWQELAMHLLSDEKEIPDWSDRPFLPRGTLHRASHHGVKAILDVMLHDAVVNHTGVTDQVLHYHAVERAYYENNPNMRNLTNDRE